MEGPVQQGMKWWQYDEQEGLLYQWNAKDKKWVKKGRSRFPPPPSRWHLGSVINSEPFYIYLSGVLAAIAALWIAVAVVPGTAADVLAPVMGVIGAFTGHAAGHSSAVRMMKEGKIEAPAKVLQPKMNSDDRAGDKQ